jgi:glycosyltransferase involved in cell wall biosynthesis
MEDDYRAVESTYFINPYRNHSLITLYAISQASRVFMLCPPARLQIWMNRKVKNNLCVAKMSRQQSIIEWACLLLFLLFKIKVIGPDQYTQIFAYLSDIFVEGEGSTVIYYQDYLHATGYKNGRIAKKICEFIIDVDRGDANWQKSYAAIKAADIVIAPTSSMANFISKYTRQAVVQAKYGGNYCDYISTIGLKSERIKKLESNKKASKSSDCLYIVARCNSYRKGVDRMFNAIKSLHEIMQKNVEIGQGVQRVHILIAGNIVEKEYVCELGSLINSLNRCKLIGIEATHLSRYEYIEVLGYADLFIMLSRRESTSLAALEALHKCTPCLLTPECGVEGFIDGRHGRLINQDCELADVLRGIVSKDGIDEITRWKEFLKIEQDNYSWSQYINAYKEILQNLIVEK